MLIQKVTLLKKQIIKGVFKIKKKLSEMMNNMYMAGQAWEKRKMETEINKT